MRQVQTITDRQAGRQAGSQVGMWSAEMLETEGGHLCGRAYSKPRTTVPDGRWGLSPPKICNRVVAFCHVTPHCR